MMLNRKNMLAVLLVCAVAGVAALQNTSKTGQLAAIEPGGSGDAAAGSSLAGADVGGAFALTDEDGKAVTDKDYAQDYKLVYFGFTNCPDVCPTDLQKMAAGFKILGEDAAKIKPLFITVDPERDTPEVLKKYTGHFDPRIVGLTGTKEQIEAVQRAYKVYAAKAQTDEPAPGAHDGEGGHDHDYMVNHSAYMYLMSPDGQPLALFSAQDTPDALAKGIRDALGSR